MSAAQRIFPNAPTHRVNPRVTFNVGFLLNVAHVITAIDHTNHALQALPFTLYKSIDYKTSSSIVGALFCNDIAEITTGVVNPIEKGHPDVIPPAGVNATEEALRNYPVGLEVKTTIGNIVTGSNLRAGSPRIGQLTGITWQAHHREVDKLLGLIWDFVPTDLTGASHPMPYITGAFYSKELEENDWGAISGTTGRNTKVTGMAASGKRKMGAGWIAILDNPDYIRKYMVALQITRL